MLEIRLLGQFDLRLDGTPAAVPSRPAQSLLAYLALHAATPHRREKLAALLWPDADEANARSYLRHALWRIRKAIEVPLPGGARYLLADDLAVAFDARSPHWLDVAALEGAAGDGAAAGVDDLLGALTVYRGELLPGFDDEWVGLERERLRAVFDRAAQHLLDGLVKDRRWPETLDWAERWIALGASPEPAFRALMAAHAALGDRSRVAAAYRRCVEALRDDLGVETSAQTRELYERLTSAAAGAAPAPPAGTPARAPDDAAPAAGEAPYKGLRHFDEADVDLFFGRERLTAQLVDRLCGRTDRAFLAIVGPSGSGKSSLLRAGLVPALKRGATAGWPVHVLTPTAHPLEALAAGLTSPTGPAAHAARLSDDLADDPRCLRLHLHRTVDPGRRCVLAVDQFEELFTLCRDEAAREAFVGNLLAAAAGPPGDGPALVVLALRADFYAHCARFPDLRDAVAAHQAYIGPMSAEELRRAIEAPARRGGWTFEPGLVDLLLRDAGDEPGALPLLAHALLETWRRRRGRTLTLTGYAAAGGIRGAIARTAERVYRGLAADERPIARRVFVRLTELGEGTQDTRRRVAREELAPRAEDAPAVERVLAALTDARLVTAADGTVEVAHEALIREWPALRRWLDEDREALRLHRRLADAAREWERLGRDPGALYRGARLAQATEWAAARADELAPPECAFLDASQNLAGREAAEREAQRQRELAAAQRLAEAERRRAGEQARAAAALRRRAFALVAAFVLAIGMAGTALFFGERAHQNALAAQAGARAAFARELAAAAIANLDVDPERSVLLALRAVDATHSADRTWTTEAEDALHRAVFASRTRLTLRGHTGEVWSVAFSPDGTRLATAGQDKTAKLWDAASGRELRTLSGHADSVNGVAFSPDGARLATSSDDHTVKVWDSATGEARLTLSGHTSWVFRVAFSPDGTRLATVSDDKTARLWDAATGEPLLVLPGPDELLDVAFSPDGARLATGSRFGTVKVWDLASGRESLILTSTPDAEMRGVAFSPDGARVAATANPAATKVWDASTGRELAAFSGHTNLLRDIAFSPDGTRVATGGLDQKLKVWDAATGRELLSLAGHTRPLNGVAFSPDGTRLASASWDGTAKLWDLSPARELLALPAPGGSGRVAFSPDGMRLAAPHAGVGRVWDAASGRELFALAGHTDRVFRVVFSPDGTRLATGSTDATAKLWDAATGRELLTLAGHTDQVWGVAFSPDGRRLATASTDGTAKVWGLAGSGQEPLTLSGHPGALASAVFSPDGTRLATTGVTAPVPPLGLDRLAIVWDAATGREVVALRGHADTVWGAAFSPDGRRLATASRDGTAKLWDAATGEEVLTLAGDGAGLSGVAFSRDGTRLATGGDFGVRVYALRIEDLVALARTRLTRPWAPDECRRFLRADRCPESAP